MRFIALSIFFMAACGGDPPANAPNAPTESSKPPAAPSENAPTVPPKPVVAQEAFYIIEIPAPATKVEAKICKSNAECDALLPPDPPTIVRRFSDESWVVVSTPADHVVRVTSDGTTATIADDQPCTGRPSRLALWRVAPTVTKTTISPTAKPRCTVD